MSTAVVSAEINAIDIPILEAIFRRIEAKKVIFKEREDDTLLNLSQEELFRIEKSKEQIKLGYTTKSIEVHKQMRERQWK